MISSEQLFGGCLLLSGIAFIVISLYAAIVSKLLPPALDAPLRDEFHYSLLVPASIPMFFFFVLLNWVGFKFFRHN
jgi:hypothetical protein